MTDADYKWIATLSNGATAVENSGQWTHQDGERKPWVRLCSFLAAEGQQLTSLRLNFRGRTIHMPRQAFERFGLEGRAKTPTHYSLQYHVEVEDPLSANPKHTHFVDLAAHYGDDYAVHFIQDVTDGNNSWVAVTDSNALAPTPRKDN